MWDFFRAPESIRKQFPEFKGVEDYPELLGLIKGALEG
jgi:hypothetical protein